MQIAFDQALSELHATAPGEINPWYYPSVSEYASLLETNGFEVRFITLFDRPTPLADGEAGMRNWITMFGSYYSAKLSPENENPSFGESRSCSTRSCSATANGWRIIEDCVLWQQNKESAHPYYVLRWNIPDVLWS